MADEEFDSDTSEASMLSGEEMRTRDAENGKSASPSASGSETVGKAHGKLPPLRKTLELGEIRVVDGIKIRTDKDGVIYEFDETMKAWFPKVDEDFLAHYQMSYGADDRTAGLRSSSCTSTSSYQFDVNSPEYAKWYAQYVSSCAAEAEPATTATRSGECEAVSGSSDLNASGDGDDDSCTSVSPQSNVYQGMNVSSPEYAEWYAKHYRELMFKSQLAAADRSVASARAQEERENAEKEAKDAAKKRKKAPDTEKKPEGWFDTSKDDKKADVYVYISNLPYDIDDDEFQSMVQRYGMVAIDPVTNKLKCKLYRDDNGDCKGDGRCCYIKSESVDLALRFLDGDELRGKKIRAERAQFNLKGDYDPSKKRRKLTNKEKRKFKEKQEKLFEWRLEQPVARKKNERFVIVSNLFEPPNLTADAKLALSEKLRKACENHGDVKKIDIYEHHKRGVASVQFKTAEQADQCITSMDNRLFGDRLVRAETWDGRTRYNIQESTVDREQRDSAWQQFLEGDDREATPSGQQAKTNPGEGDAASQQDSRTDSDSVQDTETELPANCTGAARLKSRDTSMNEDAKKSSPGDDSTAAAAGGDFGEDDEWGKGGDAALMSDTDSECDTKSTDEDEQPISNANHPLTDSSEMA